MYLLRGANSWQESGFYSELYSEEGTIDNSSFMPDNVAYAQHLNGNTPFISATTNLCTAASFSNKNRIYIIKIPVEDVYVYRDQEFQDLMEDEYMIPDFIAAHEIIRSFRFDKFKQIFRFLKQDIGLEIEPMDLGEDENSILNPALDKIEEIMDFNNGSPWLDSIFKGVQDKCMYGQFTHGVMKYTPTEDNKKLVKKNG